MAELFGDTANDGQMSDLEDTLGGSEDTGLDGDGAIPGDAAADDEPLGNPADFPPELQGHWSRMSRAYQARLAELRQRESELDSVQQRAQLVDRFNQDPHGTLQQLASQYGYQLDRPGQTPQSSSGNPSADIPPEVLRAAQHAFADAPDLQFLAPYVARALAPLQQQQQQQQQESRHSQATQAYQHEVEALNQIAPGWEQHEAEMSERLSFIRQIGRAHV